MEASPKIRVTCSSIDGYRLSRSFKTLVGARRFAVKYVGATPEFGSSYAISEDGVGKVTVRGVTLAELFAVAKEPDGGRIAEQVAEYAVTNEAGQTVAVILSIGSSQDIEDAIEDMPF